MQFWLKWQSGALAGVRLSRYSQIFLSCAWYQWVHPLILSVRRTIKSTFCLIHTQGPLPPTLDGIVVKFCIGAVACNWSETQRGVSLTKFYYCSTKYRWGQGPCGFIFQSYTQHNCGLSSLKMMTIIDTVVLVCNKYL